MANYRQRGQKGQFSEEKEVGIERLPRVERQILMELNLLKNKMIHEINAYLLVTAKNYQATFNVH